MKDADDFDEYIDGSLFGETIEKYYDDHGFIYAKRMKRSEPVVRAEQDRTVPLKTMPHYSDPVYSRGKAHLVFGTEKYTGKGQAGWDYADRIWQWNATKAQAAHDAANEAGHERRTADWYEAYLTVYFGRPVHLFGIMAGVNVSNGYPYQVFGYVFKDGE